jgi:hypothetical protein
MHQGAFARANDGGEGSGGVVADIRDPATTLTNPTAG